MARLRSFAAIALIGSLLLATGGTAAAASSAQATGPVRAAVPGLPIPVIDLGFDCFGPALIGDSAAQVPQLQTKSSFVIVTNSQQTPVSTPFQAPSLFLGSGSVDVMKCFFTYPAGTIRGAPFTRSDFPCSYEGRVFHSFAQSMIIVRETWAVMVCLGSGVTLGSVPSARASGTR